MTLFRRSHLPSPPPAGGPPRPPEGRQQAPWQRPRGAWVSEGPRDPDLDPDYDPCGSGPVAVAGSKSNGGRA